MRQFECGRCDRQRDLRCVTHLSLTNVKMLTILQHIPPTSDFRAPKCVHTPIPSTTSSNTNEGVYISPAHSLCSSHTLTTTRTHATRLTARSPACCAPPSQYARSTFPSLCPATQALDVRTGEVIRNANGRMEREHADLFGVLENRSRTELTELGRLYLRLQ